MGDWMGLVLLSVVGLALCFLPLIWWTHRGERGFKPGLFSRKRNVVDEVPNCDAEGNPWDNVFHVVIGGYHKVPGLSTIQIMNLMVTQRLYFCLSENKEKVELLNDVKKKIGYYPKMEPHFEEIRTRLLHGEQIDAWVYDIGTDRGACFCKIKVVVYRHEVDWNCAAAVHCILCGKMISDNEFHICPECARQADAFLAEMLSEIPKLQESANRAGQEGDILFQRDLLQKILAWLYRYKGEYDSKGFHAVKEDIDEQICQVEHAYHTAQKELSGGGTTV